MAAVKTGSEQPDSFSFHIFLFWKKEKNNEKDTLWHINQNSRTTKRKIFLPCLYMFHNQYLFDKSKQSA